MAGMIASRPVGGMRDNPIGPYGRTNNHKAYGRGKKGNGRNGSLVGYMGRYLCPNNTQSTEE